MKKVVSTLVILLLLSMSEPVLTSNLAASKGERGLGFPYYDLYKKPVGTLANVDMDLTRTVTPITTYARVYWYKGQMRIGNGDPTPAVYRYSVHIVRNDASGSAILAVVALKRMNGTQAYEFQFVNVTTFMIAPSGSVTVELSWWEDGSAAVTFAPYCTWNLSMLTNPVTSNAIDTNPANNEVSAPPGSMMAQGPLFCDFNGDGVLDILDAVTMSFNFGARAGEPEYNADIDLNGDGEIDILDCILLVKAFQFGLHLPD